MNINVTGEYNRHGYTVAQNGIDVYAAGNHRQDSKQDALDPRDQMNLREIRSACIRSCKQTKGTFTGVERVNDEK